MTDTAFTGDGAAPSSEERGLAMVGYGLLFVSPFVFGLTALIAVVVAYLRKGPAEDLVRRHYRFQIRCFWVAFALAVVAALALMIGVATYAIDTVGAILADAPRDAWEAVGMEVDPGVPVVFFVGLLVFLATYALSSLWLLATSVFGAIRLGAGKPVGRAA